MVGIVLTEKRAVHMCAYKTFTDVYNMQRKAGEQWLVTSVMTDSHICDVYEQVPPAISILVHMPEGLLL